VSRHIITQGGKPAFVVTEAAAVRAFLKNPGETFPDTVVAVILGGTPVLKALREHRGLTQAALAKACATSAVYIAQIERGERQAGRKLLAKLSKALGVASDLLT